MVKNWKDGDSTLEESFACYEAGDEAGEVPERSD